MDEILGPFTDQLLFQAFCLSGGEPHLVACFFQDTLTIYSHL